MATQSHAGAPRAHPQAQDPHEVDARVFWNWVWESVYPALGWVLIALGVLAIGLGWWGTSRTAIVAKQLPYLASGGIGGIALVVLGSRFFVMQDLRRDSGRLDRLEQMVQELHEVLLTGAGQEPAASTNGRQGSATGTFLVLPGGERFHRAGCPMLEGKEGVSRVRSSTVSRRGLEPCPLCEPELAKA